jgi:BirA family biotin operon repressor/biotin-[acetyl-CoA-carboxylase] ligase
VSKHFQTLNFNSIDSTHTYVLGDKEGEDVLVIAKEQTKGVTSKPDEQWYSDSGGLFVSLRVTNRGMSRNRKKVADKVGTEVSKLFSDLFNLNIEYRKPNDFYTSDKKIGGVLVTLNNLTTIYSLGLNINQSVLPEDIANKATSVFLETNQEHDMTEVVNTLAAYFDNLLTEYADSIPRYSKPLLTHPYKRRRSYVNKRIQ